MHVRAQVAMVMNLDKCIGCHTCSVTCKQVWTNRPGTEYVWFNNVETKPGLGYPQRWADQSQWRGGTENALTTIAMKPTHMIGAYAQLSWAPNYYGPTGSNRDSVTVVRKRRQEVTY